MAQSLAKKRFLESSSGDMPSIRAVRPTDLIPLIAFLRNDLHSEVTAGVWPAVWGDSDRKRLRVMLPRLFTRPGSRSQAWGSFGKREVKGLALARPRAGKLAWDVEGLLIQQEDRQTGVDLLDHLAGEVARRGARRIFMAIPVASNMVRLASQAAFRNFTSETLYAVRLPSAFSDNGRVHARPRLRHDSQALFQLYNAAVPCRVRSAEAMTMDEWISLDKGSRPWAPSLSGSRQQMVWERGTVLVGWLIVTFGPRSQHLELLVHPDRASDAEEMVRYALAQVSHRVPVYFTVRDYQSETGSALDRLGFDRVGDYLLFSRELAARVPARGLVPARA